MTGTTLHRASEADAECLSNLLELYIHDVCDIFPSVELASNGRFGYPKLPLYWTEPERRFAFVIRHDDRVAGFALATRGSPVAPDPETLDIAEFFVLRRYRRLGVGREAARLLWQALPGAWTVRVAERNQRALTFWSSVVAEFAAGASTERTLAGTPNTWRVFSFEAGTAPSSSRQTLNRSSG